MRHNLLLPSPSLGAAARPRLVAARVAQPLHRDGPAAAGGGRELVPPPSPEVAAQMAELGYDLETSGLKYLSNDARVGGAGRGGAGRSGRRAGGAGPGGRVGHSAGA